MFEVWAEFSIKTKFQTDGENNHDDVFFQKRRWDIILLMYNFLKIKIEPFPFFI